MTREQAIQAAEERNALGFEGDTFMREKFEEIIHDHKIKTVIETGTYLGATTKILASLVEFVHTIEINKDHFARAEKTLADLENVVLWEGNSAQHLEALLPLVHGPLFIFLDAHWQQYNPLIDELAAIARNKIKPACIAIHDFKVPGRPLLGFDTYGGQDYEWDWIRKSIEEIYGIGQFTIEYNSEATGAMRGIIYIYPCA